MKLDDLHVFESSDWKTIERQFVGSYGPTYAFVTENKGTVAEALEIYLEAFLCYTQLLDLRGLKLLEKSETLIYSFSRKLWLQKLDRRRVDLNFVVHRREFFEMDDAFHEIDAINSRSAKTAEKLAQIGEPFRTLLLECVGRKKSLGDVAPRLGFTDEDRAFAQINKGIRKLIKLTESKEFDLKDEEFTLLLRYVLDGSTAEKITQKDSDKIVVTMISRSVAMIRNYVSRSHRMQLLKEMQENLVPLTGSNMRAQSQPEIAKKNKMKPVLIFGATAFMAVVISAITAFGIVGSMHVEAELPLPVNADTLAMVPEIELEIKKPGFVASAFALNSEGYFLSTAVELKAASKISLVRPETGEQFDAEVIALDTIHNLALIKSKPETTGIHPVPYRFSPDMPKIGEVLYTLGFPQEELYYSDGSLNQIRNGFGSIAFQNASPGSPVISANGQIVGMVSAIGEVPANGCQMVSVDKILGLFESVATEKELKINLPQRNRLFYSDKSRQIEQISPLVYRVQRIPKN